MRIAEITLAPGQVGYYDDLSNTRLTVTNPNKIILAGTNVSNLLTAVKEKKIILLWGSLYTHQITQMATQSTRVAFIVPEAAPPDEDEEEKEEEDPKEETELKEENELQKNDKTEPEVATLSLESNTAVEKTNAKRSRTKTVVKKSTVKESKTVENNSAVLE